jgi:ribose 5-phosphate isomerase A
VDVEEEKQLAARAAADLVEDHLLVGLGTGTTVAYLVVELARRGSRATFVATSPRTERLALDGGLSVTTFDTQSRLDLAIDGADQISEHRWLIKGGGGAHTREKIVAASADRFVVIADSTKQVAALHPPVPLELLRFGLEATLRELAPTTLRGADVSPDGGVIADYRGDVGDPATLAQRLSTVPGVIGHGLFAPELVHEIIVGVGATTRRVSAGGPS